MTNICSIEGDLLLYDFGLAQDWHGRQNFVLTPFTQIELMFMQTIIALMMVYDE